MPMQLDFVILGGPAMRRSLQLTQARHEARCSR